jgi:hypothetical protein
MTMKPALNLCVIFSVSVLLIAGCGESDAKPVGTANGIVTYKAKPLGNVNVTFASQTTGDAAMAVVGSDGTFKFATPIPAGIYKVFISAPTPPPPGSGGPAVMPMPDIPGAYMKLETTTLRAEVDPGKNEPIAVDLK